MIESNQVGRSSPDVDRPTRHRHLIGVQAGDTSADVHRASLSARLPPAGADAAAPEWLETQADDEFVQTIADFLLECGATPEDLHDAARPDLKARIATAMGIRSPGPRLSLVPEPEPEAEL